MSANKKIFVANWKMQLSFSQSCAFMHDNYNALKQLTNKHTIIVCPTFPALSMLAALCKNSDLYIGAQNVSRHPLGAYTGQVSAQSLVDVGCTYCIIGHSEVRQYMHETNIDIEHKLKELLKHNITPIICIGENKQQYDKQETYSVLKEQLLANLAIIASQSHPISSYIIAYEPVWAVDSQESLPFETISNIFAWLDQQCSTLTSAPFALLYGGNAHSTNASQLLQIKHVDGLMLGRASLDISEFTKIVANH